MDLVLCVSDVQQDMRVRDAKKTLMTVPVSHVPMVELAKTVCTTSSVIVLMVIIYSRFMIASVHSREGFVWKGFSVLFWVV